MDVPLTNPLDYAPHFTMGGTVTSSTGGNNYLDAIKWTADGLVPAIAQDSTTGKILMMAWMNRESLALTVQEGQAVYWSRSRGQLWRKGETSGHTQTVREIKLDCDADVLVLSVEQRGGIACHTGRESCFFRTLIDGKWIENIPVTTQKETNHE